MFLITYRYILCIFALFIGIIIIFAIFLVIYSAMSTKGVTIHPQQIFCCFDLLIYQLLWSLLLLGCSIFQPHSFQPQYQSQTSLQSRTGPVQGQNRVFPVKFFSQGKTCFHYRDFPARKNLVFIAGNGFCSV